jgi:hypothetical protein
MGKRLLVSATLLFFIATFTACKKQDDETKPLRSKIIGKWQVNKIEVTNYAEGNGTTVTNTYGTSDYLDFKDNESDDVELGLGTNRSVGTFSTTVANTLHIDFSSKDLDCVVNTITDNQFQFTGTVTGSNPKITETYYLSR